MRKFLLVLLICCIDTAIIIDTPIKDRNITIYKDTKLNGAFDPDNAYQTTCHPSSLYVESDNETNRDFYIHNSDVLQMQLIVNSHVIYIPANSTMLYKHFYETCETDWTHIKISFGDLHVQYFRMCRPFKAQLHPVILLVIAAIILVYIGSIYGQNHLVLFGEEQHGDIDAKQAVCFIFIASGGLMLLYLFGEYIKIFLQIWVLFVGFTALQNIFTDIFTSIGMLGDGIVLNLPFIGPVSEKRMVTGFIALGIVVGYFMTANWMISNVIAVALVMLMFKLIEIDSLRTATILLTMAFFYDIFWVFYSHIFFGQSVMSEVATQIDLPMKLQCPELFTMAYPIAKCSLIGLGDIILPGIVLKYLYRCDINIGTSKLFPLAYLGYVCGLVACIYCLLANQVAQPALLYLVPSIIIPVILYALATSNFRIIWSGDLEKHQTESKRIEQVDQDYELAAGEI